MFAFKCYLSCSAMSLIFANAIAPAVLFGQNSLTSTFSFFLSLSCCFDLTFYLLQCSSRRYSSWIGLSKFPRGFFTRAPRIWSSLSWNSSLIMAIFHFLLFLLSSLIITTSPMLVLTALNLCCMLCLSRRVVTYSRCHLLQAIYLYIFSHTFVIFAN